MMMISLQTVRDHFRDRLKVFPETTSIQLSDKQAEILHTIGLPNYKGYGGTYIMLNTLELIDNRYLKFATREDDEDTYFEFLDLKTGHVVFQFLDKEYNLLNTSLESYLIYIYIYMRFAKEVKLPQTLGIYQENENHQKYADELNRRFLEWNDDVEKGSWSALIEEMGYGVI